MNAVIGTIYGVAVALILCIFTCTLWGCRVRISLSKTLRSLSD